MHGRFKCCVVFQDKFFSYSAIQEKIMRLYAALRMP